MSSAQTPRPNETLLDLLDEISPELARQAFSHASWTRPRSESYERLACVGDVVLALAVSSRLYPVLAAYGVGRLTTVRSQVVCEAATAQVAVELGLHERLIAQAPEGAEPGLQMLIESRRVLSSICEAVIGAVYLGCGYERVADPVIAAFAQQIEKALNHSVDFKSALQGNAAQRGWIVDYVAVEQTGPPHARHYVVGAWIDEREFGRGEGRTKKIAQQAAAAQALEALNRDEG